MIISRRDEVEGYTTRDGSEIRELMHPEVHGNHNQSLAEAVVAPGQTTALHRHEYSEEIYFIAVGEGMMRLGNNEFGVSAGDTICIPPGTPHNISNIGKAELVILCCCSPAYSHGDTVLL